MKRQILLIPLILIIGILISANPAIDYVKAAGVTTVTTKDQFKDAINQDGDSNIKLGADISGVYNLTIPEGKNVTIDLNGHTIDVGLYSGVNSPAFKKPLFWIDGNLVINDSIGNGAIKGASYSALVIYSTGSVTMNGGIFTKNWSNLSGGAVTVLGGSFTMNGGELFNNYTAYTAGSKGRGGAIYMQNFDDSECEVTINGGAISWNFATYGGGIYVGSGTLTINGGAIGSTTDFNHMGNQTAKSERGSGIYIDTGTLEMTGGEIRGQDKTGLVVSEKGTFNLKGGKIIGNYIGVYNFGTMNMTGGEIASDDLYGGQYNGVIVDCGATFWMKSGSIHNNSVGVTVKGISTDGEEKPSLFHMTGGEIKDNSGNEKGAGVNVSEGGAMVMSGGTISGNTTGMYSLNNYYGGGVCVIDQDSQFAMTGGTIKDNSCPEGDGGGIYVGKGATCILAGGTITGNSASHEYGQHYGGGVFVDYDGNCQISGNPVITGNYLLDKNNTVNNLHIDQSNYGSKRLLTVSAPLTTGAKIGITVNNNYMPVNVSEVFNTYNGSDVAGQYFFSDNPKYHVTKDYYGEVILKDCKSTLNKVAAKAATCTETGNKEHYQCPVCKELFTDASGTVYTTNALITTPAIGHNYGEPTYTWSNDHSKVTAKRVCKNDASHVETENGTITSTETLAENCQAIGKISYFATFKNSAFSPQTDIITTTKGPHKAGEQVIENIVASTCTDPGSCDFVHYCTYCNAEISREHKTYPAMGHDFTEWEQVQSSRFRYCKRCGAYETEAVTWNTCTHVKEYISEEKATCVTYGMKAHYKCNLCDSVFKKEDDTTPVTKDQMESLVIPMDKVNGHKWSATLRENEKAADCLNADCYDNVKYCELCGKREVINTYTGNPLGHDYDTPVYTWSADNSKVTATRICKRDAAHVEKETVDTTQQVTPATCTTKGSITYTALFKTPGFVKQTKTVDGDDIIGHDWNDTVYTWSADNSEVTATHTCKACRKVESEKVATISRVTKAATCTQDGVTTYTALFTNPLFASQTKQLTNINKTGHNWGDPVYTWSDDCKTCEAIRTCKNNPEEIESEIVDTTSKITKQSTCCEKGETTYTAVFTKQVFTTQTKVVKDVALDMNNHVKGEAVKENVVPATCTEPETYDEVICCKVHPDVVISKTRKTGAAALGHEWDGGREDWEKYTYIEEDDANYKYKPYKHYKICARDNNHKELEDHDFEEVYLSDIKWYICKKCCYQVMADQMPEKCQHLTLAGIFEKPATCTTSGIKAHLECDNCGACFINETGTLPVEVSLDALIIPALGHDPGDVVKSNIIAATCADSGSHDETVNCKRCNELISNKHVVDDAALGHDYEVLDAKEATCKEDGCTKYKCSRCNEEYTENYTAKKHLEETDPEVEPTCTKAGLTEGSHCAYCGDIIKAQEEIPPLGHDWDEATYIWADDNASVEASHQCKRPDKVNEREVVDTTNEVTKEPNCSEAGEVTYTAVFTKDGFEKQTKVVPEIAIDPNKHIPNEAVKEKEVKATCTLAGSYDEVIYCSKCNKELQRTAKKTDALGHKWGKWTVTKDSSVSEEGIEERTCSVCGEKESRTLEKIAPVSDEEIDKQIIDHKGEKDLKGSKFTMLMAKGVPVSNKSIKLIWKAVPGAKEYIIYGNKCGKKNKYKRITAVKTTKLIRKKLKVGTYYKHLIVAIDENGQILATSKTIHCVTNGGKNGNNTKVVLSRDKLTLNVGKSKKITAKLKTKKPVRIHRDIAWESDDPAIATVDNKGKIKAVSNGTCYVYAYAQNGVYSRIKVTVKGQ